jgi:hypothetical protein
MATDNLTDTPSPGGVTAGGRVHSAPLPAPAQRALTFGLMISALRCTVQYVVLPFVLPWIGVARTLPIWATVILSLVALAALVRNVRYLWRLRHARRWSYLFISGAVVASLVLFMVVDLHSLL